MNCNEVKDLIFESFGVQENNETLQKHLSSCEDCRKLYETLAAQAQDFGTDKNFELNQSEQANLLEKINADIDRQEIDKAVNITPAWKSYVPMAAAILLVLGVGFISQLIFKFGSGTDTATNQNDRVAYVGLTDEDITEIKSIELDEFVDQYSSQYDIDDEINMLDDLSEEEYQYLNENLDIGEIL